jgi:tetratricopeptide (TPR) repeat protein
MLAGGAVAFGLAGYVLQGRAGLASSGPVAARDAEVRLPDPEMRALLFGRFGAEAERLAYADAYLRAGRPDIAARVMQLGLQRSPRNPQLWAGLAMAIVAHEGGVLSPASEFAFRKAEAIAPNYPGTWYFHALALAENGRIAEARAAFLMLLDRVPADAPQRPAIVARVVESGLVSAREAAQRPIARP